MLRKQPILNFVRQNFKTLQLLFFGLHITIQETAMKRQNFHIGSFLIGLLAGGILLVLLALAMPLRTDTQAVQLLQAKSQQFNSTANRSLDKTWSQIRSEVSINRQKIARDVNQTFNKEFHGIVVSLHSPSLLPCTWFSWLDKQSVHLATLVGIHASLWNPPFCSTK
jgi:hypothetical protein